MTGVAYVPVEAPSVAPRPFGLLGVAQPAAPLPDEHWRSGSIFQAMSCAVAGLDVEPCLPYGTTDLTLAIEAGRPTEFARTIVVYHGVACSPVGFNDEEERARARAVLVNGEQRAIEREFLSGQAGLRPRLADPHDTVVTTAAADPVKALALLEDAIGWGYGGVGAIHVPPSGVTYLAAHQLVREDLAGLYTPAGTRIVVGAGYDGRATDGTAPSAGQEWWYATGALEYRRSDVEFFTDERSQWFDRTVNTATVVAMRAYQIMWDCPNVALTGSDADASLAANEGSLGYSLPIAYAAQVALS